jgi:hypothetical protein
MIIEKTLKFQVAEADAPKLMTWDEADAYAKSLGNGWRLPTREELLLMYEKRNEIGGFETEYRVSDNGHWYWSCTEHRTDRSDVYNVQFTDGDFSWNSKGHYALSVRPVRDC